MSTSHPLPSWSSRQTSRRNLPLITLLAAAVPLLAACPPPAPPTPQPTVPLSSAPSDAPSSSTSASAAAALPPLPVDPLTISILLPRAPPNATVDGDLSEWGSLEPPRESDQTHVAGSHLAVAFRPTDVLLAVQLGEKAKDGIWMTMGVEPPEVTKVGDVARGDFTSDFVCEYKQIQKGDGIVVNGPRNLPEVIAACKALIARYEQLVAKHKERFLRRYRVDKEGIRAVDAAGALSPIPGAQAIYKPGDAQKSASVEISLPLTALPRLTQAPLASVGIAADLVGTTPPPAATQDSLSHMNLKEPVSFEPWGELRAQTFAALGKTFFPPGLSYQPGDPSHVETFRYPAGDRHSVVPVVETLYEKKAEMGDVEIGIASVYGYPSLAIFRKGKLVQLAERDSDLPPPDLGGRLLFRGTATRDGELHAFFYSENAMTMAYGFQRPFWYVIAVTADGSYHFAGDGSADDVTRWDDAWDFTTPDMTSFGYRGTTHFAKGMDEPSDKLGGVEITYRWDPKVKKYTSTKTLIPLPKRPKK